MTGSVAKGIRAIISEKGFRQGYVAKKASFTDTQFSDMLNGRKLILAEYLPRIADAMGVSVQAIYA